MARPTAISMIPTTYMRVVEPTGRTALASGPTYPSQFASRLKNLSSPARNAARPSPHLSAIRAESRLFSIVMMGYLLPYRASEGAFGSREPFRVQPTLSGRDRDG